MNHVQKQTSCDCNVKVYTQVSYASHEVADLGGSMRKRVLWTVVMQQLKSRARLAAPRTSLLWFKS